jgi:hypothetical protein
LLHAKSLTEKEKRNSIEHPWENTNNVQAVYLHTLDDVNTSDLRMLGRTLFDVGTFSSVEDCYDAIDNRLRVIVERELLLRGVSDFVLIYDPEAEYSSPSEKPQSYRDVETVHLFEYIFTEFLDPLRAAVKYKSYEEEKETVASFKEFVKGSSFAPYASQCTEHIITATTDKPYRVGEIIRTYIDLMEAVHTRNYAKAHTTKQRLALIDQKKPTILYPFLRKY